MNRRLGDEGSHSVELAAGWTIFLLAVAVLAVAFQIRQASDAVGTAAGQAARGASLAASPDDAARSANDTVRADLESGICVPGTVEVHTDLSQFRPGGLVTVTAGCRVHPLLGPSRRVQATADEVIDLYRAIPGGTQ